MCYSIVLKLPIIVSVFTITITLFLTNIFTIIPKHIPGVAGSSKSRIEGDDDDVESCCSTCSSSSSSDEAAAYALPPRRAYGGVRISYVPNDAVACARKRTPTSSMSNQAHRDADKCIVSWWSSEEFQIIFTSISMYCSLRETLLLHCQVMWRRNSCESRTDEQREKYGLTR